MKGRKKFRWDRLAIYILSIVVIVLVCANYKVETSTDWNDEFHTYATRIQVVRK